MNKNCIILEIRKSFVLDPLATPPGSLCIRKEIGIEVWPDTSDEDGPCFLYTPEEAAAEVARRTQAYNPRARYQVVTLAP